MVIEIAVREGGGGGLLGGTPPTTSTPGSHPKPNQLGFPHYQRVMPNTVPLLRLSVWICAHASIQSFFRARAGAPLCVGSC